MGGEGALVLVVEDEPQMLRFLRTTLSSQGFKVAEAMTGKAGIEMAAFQNPEVILLDLMLPDIDGLEVIRTVREWSRTPIVVISARGREDDKIAALDLGADDYLTKPFGTGELFARIRVSLRHAVKAGSDEQAVFTLEDLKVDMAKRQVFVRGEEIHLTKREYRLLTTLVKHAGRVVTHRQLLQEVWGPGYETELPYLRVYMGQLRRKLEVEPAQPRFLLTEPGVGYRLKGD